MRKKGQILVITLLVLTILSILTVSLVILNSRDVSQTVNREVYEKIYNSTETKLKEVLNVAADPSVSLSNLSTQYSTCLNLGGAISTYECNFVIPSDDSSSAITYSDKLTVSNEKDIVDYSLNKDRPLSISLDGYSSFLNITISKAAALDFTLIYLQGGVYKAYSGVYDPSATAYNSTDATFKSYFTPDSVNPLAFKLTFPASYNAFKLLSITPRLKTASDSLLITVKADQLNIATYPAQIRKFFSQAYTTNDPDSPSVKIITQIPLQPQLDGLLDYSLLTPDTVKISN